MEELRLVRTFSSMCLFEAAVESKTINDSGSLFWQKSLSDGILPTCDLPLKELVLH